MHSTVIETELITTRVYNGEGEYLTVLYAVIYVPVKYPAYSRLFL